jgi:hypothetical protein
MIGTGLSKPLFSLLRWFAAGRGRSPAAVVRFSLNFEAALRYVLVNNRAEGNAPPTVQGLAEMLHD